MTASTPQTPRHVWVDGELLPADAPHVSAFDRGFQLGDGIFETLRARGGRVTELDAHLDRLRRSAAGLSIALAGDAAPSVASGIQALLEAEGLAGEDGDAAIRITVSRGRFTGRGLLPTDDPTPTIVVQAWPVVPPPPGHLERGLHLVASTVRRDPSNPLAALKTTSRADFVFARIEARAAGADDALFLTIDGFLSEATTANVFVVRGRSLATPSLDCAILAGTTREWILAWARGAGLDAKEARLRAEDLAAADEVFLSSSVAGILPVTRFAGRAIGKGAPGPWTAAAREAREAFIGGESSPPRAAAGGSHGG
ncbi:MAG TPA: aminotransferase class IV [Candidatus Limnocylindrales bacterium]|nr:aminotransferase class IV [Candidatus Limnocylindrales bacterium]